MVLKKSSSRKSYKRKSVSKACRKSYKRKSASKRDRRSYKRKSASKRARRSYKRKSASKVVLNNRSSFDSFDSFGSFDSEDFETKSIEELEILLGNAKKRVDVLQKILNKKKDELFPRGGGMLGFLDSRGIIPEDILLKISNFMTIEELFKLSMLSTENKRQLKNVFKCRDVILEGKNALRYFCDSKFRNVLSNAKTLSIDIDFRDYICGIFYYFDILSRTCRDIVPVNVDNVHNLISLKIFIETDTDLMNHPDIKFFIERINLQNLKNLTTLSLHPNRDYVPGMWGGSTWVGNNEHLDIGFINELKDLITLDISYNAFLVDINSLTNLKNLKTLILSHNDKLSDISSITALKNLTTLDLSHNKNLVDVSALSSLKNLTTLDLSHNENLIDIRALASLKNLTTLNLVGTAIKFR